MWYSEAYAYQLVEVNIDKKNNNKKLKLKKKTGSLLKQTGKNKQGWINENWKKKKFDTWIVSSSSRDYDYFVD